MSIIMNVENIGNFFKEMKNDTVSVINNKDKSESIQNQRISALCYRVIGLIGVTFGALATISLAASFILSPLTNTVFLTFSVAIMIISYDHIIIGNNKRSIIKDCDKICSRSPYSIASGIFSLTRKAYKESTSEVPVDYEGTIIYKPVYRMLNNKTAAQTA